MESEHIATQEEVAPQQEIVAEEHAHEHNHEHEHEHHEIPHKKITPEQFMSMIRGMLIDEKISLQQARELRRSFGIANSYFTKRKVSNAKKKRKRAMAKASRRKNRHNNSMKGHKRNSGHFTSTAR